MQIQQKKWQQNSGWVELSTTDVKDSAQWVLVFGGSRVIKDSAQLSLIKSWYPKAHILLCSTAGEIIGTQVLDDSLCVTAVSFKNTRLEFGQTVVSSSEESEHAGSILAASIPHEGLVHVMVFSEGLKINGTKLVDGLRANLPAEVSVTGGLVGDGAVFKETVVGLDSAPVSGKVVVIGFYGSGFQVGYGSFGGWDPFGPERIITKSTNNVLYELDDKPALSLYKEYLGEKAKDLPGSGLLFPLSLRVKTTSGETNIVRTILAVDEATQSMTFAGDMPVGTPAQLMKANFDRLIDGAGEAASMGVKQFENNGVELAILVSCIGRKLVLQERTEEEIEAVQNIIGKKAVITGFYSYGELCPSNASAKQCQLHNQTMTVTMFRET